jgi:hypothetical protein
MMSSTDVALDVFRVLETGDPALAVETAGPRFRNRAAVVAPAACAKPGPAGLLASSAWMRYAFRDLHFEILDTAEQDGRVFVRLRMQGTHTAPFVQYKDGELAQSVTISRCSASSVSSHRRLRSDWHPSSGRSAARRNEPQRTSPRQQMPLRGPDHQQGPRRSCCAGWRRHVAGVDRARKAAGDTPTCRLNAALNALSELYPSVNANAPTRVSPELRARFASSIRQAIR